MNLLQRMLPESQRHTLDELDAQLDLRVGDRVAKRSGFWVMLVLSAVIAIAGVLTDSTATVIGAMIIAPLATPIMGIALGVVKAQRSLILRSMSFVGGGLLVVVVLGALAARVIPDPASLLQNSQVLGRTSPQLLDLVAAFATGFAGAFALCRRDLGAILPGVAIAISLVPPLGVVGVCAGRGEFGLAFGALVLFLSNVVALVIAGSIVFTLYGYGRETTERLPKRSRAYVTMIILLLFVLVPLGLNTTSTILTATYDARVQEAVDQWVIDVPHAEVTSTAWHGFDVIVSLKSPNQVVHAPEALRALLTRDGVPSWVGVTVDLSVGRIIPVG
jgi:uncharacterized hydrophobic protein (TIGR00271 family)